MYRKKYSKMIAAIMMAVMSVTPVMADDEVHHASVGESITVYSQSNPSGYSSGSVYNSRENDRTDLTGSSVSHSGSSVAARITPQNVLDAGSGYLSIRNILENTVNKAKLNTGNTKAFMTGADTVFITETSISPDDILRLSGHYAGYLDAMGGDYIENHGLADIYDFAKFAGSYSEKNYTDANYGAANSKDRVYGGIPTQTRTGYSPDDEDMVMYPGMMRKMVDGADNSEVVNLALASFWAENGRFNGTFSGFAANGLTWLANILTDGWGLWIDDTALASGTAPISLTSSTNNASWLALQEIGGLSGIRDDLVKNGLNGTATYSDRIRTLLEGIKSGYIGNGGTIGAGGIETASAALIDDYKLLYMENLHLSDVTTTSREVISYYDDTRIWTVYDYYTGAEIQSVTTNNPLRSFTFTAEDEGRYVIKCSALARCRQTIQAVYETYDYLIDPTSGVILYFLERKNNSPIYLEDTEEDIRVATGEYFIIDVDENGNVNVGDSNSREVITERIR